MFDKTKNRPFVFLQQEMSECGLVALSAAAAIHGINVDLDFLKSNGFYSQRGLKISSLIKVAESIGLSATPIKIDSRFSNPKMATIVLIDNNHYWVIGHTRAGGIDIFDPSRGWFSLTLQALQQRISGLALEIGPGYAKFIPTSNKVWLWMKLHIKIKPILFAPVALSGLAMIATLISPQITQNILTDSGSSKPLSDSVLAGIIGVCVSGLTGVVTVFLAQYSAAITGHTIRKTLTEDLIKLLFKMPQSYFDRQSSSIISGRVSSISDAHSFILSLLTSTFLTTLVGLGALLVLLFKSTEIALLCTISGLTSWILARLMQPFLLSRYEATTVLTLGFREKLIQSISAYSSIKLARAINKVNEKLANLYEEANDAITRQDKFDAVAGIYTTMHALFFSISTLIVCSILISQVKMTLPEYVSAMAYFGMAGAGFGAVQSLWRASIWLKNVEGRISGILEHKHVEAERNFIQDEEWAVLIENIEFSYSKFDPPVLKNLSLSVKIGETVVIKAPTGYGKTTLAKLMLGLIEPSSGQILINEIFSSKYSGFVLQDDKLINGSIRDNIDFFRGFTGSEIEVAAKLACINKDIFDMPMKYNTIVGEGVSGLSGGQRQRLLLARSFVGNPSLLVLDEATSALDMETERKIIDGIESFNCTKIIFTHRESVCSIADRVIDLELGCDFNES